MKGEPRVQETDPASFCNSQEEGRCASYARGGTGGPPAREDAAVVHNLRHRAPPVLHDLVGSRVSCRKHPRVSTQLSHASTGQNPPPHFFPGSSPASIRSRACVVTRPRDRANQNTYYAHKSANQEAPYYPGALLHPASPLTSTGRAEQSEHPEASAPGKPRRALSKAASRGRHCPRRVPGPRGPCWGRSQGGGRRRGRPRAVIGGRPAVAEVLVAARATQAESRLASREDAAVPGAPHVLYALPAPQRPVAGLGAHLPAGLDAVAGALRADARPPVPARGRPALLRLPEHGALLLRELHRGPDIAIWRFAKK